MKTYEVVFETDAGMVMCQIAGRNLKEVTKKLKEEFPKDIGSDGFITDDDGNEHPINW